MNYLYYYLLITADTAEREVLEETGIIAGKGTRSIFRIIICSIFRSSVNHCISTASPHANSFWTIWSLFHMSDETAYLWYHSMSNWNIQVRVGGAKGTPGVAIGNHTDQSDCRVDVERVWWRLQRGRHFVGGASFRTSRPHLQTVFNENGIRRERKRAIINYSKILISNFPSNTFY